ncbi:zinc-ribbon domain-containing protein [soil metagenome]
MILTCPSCATSYFTPDEAIGTNGRRVRCKACAHIWHAALADEPLELDATPEDAAALAPQAGSGPGFGKRDEASESLAETPAPELPKAFRARAEQQRRIRRAATHGAVWAGLASAFVAILGAAWLFRVEVVDLYPRAAAAYAMVGATVNPVGLQFEAVGAKASANDPAKVLVSGALRNVRDREIIAPPIRVALLDAHGAEIGHAVITIDAAPVLPGGVQGFAAVISDPGARGVSVGANFVARPKGPRAVDADPATKETTDHAPPHADAARTDAARVLPHVDAVAAPVLAPAGPPSGLRPALTGETNLPLDAAPIDARPIAAVQSPATPPLDSHHGEAVSASHHG